MVFLNRYIILSFIKKAISTKNGVASLAEIYDSVLNHQNADFSKYSDSKSVIRNTLYIHSSDCDIFRGTPGDSNDLFYAVKQKGNGFWGLRALKRTDENIVFDNVYFEGNVDLYPHLIRERNTLLIKEAKNMFKSKNGGQLFCEVCNFDFQKAYGSLGKDYIEGHHIIPISSFNEEHEVRIEEIALVCSNCHSMLHQKQPPISIEELKKILSKYNT